ncbi:TPA: hypothetical protein ACGO3F_001285 [Streptococcus suis]
MSYQQRERLMELYEKGVLTKEEAKACFLTFDERPEQLFVEEKTKLSFSLPSLKVFSSTKRQQAYQFQGIESLFIRLTSGKVVFSKSKSDDLQVKIVYPSQTREEDLPQFFVENKGLYYSSAVSCQLMVFLPEAWLSILDLDLGKAEARLDYLPFEDMAVHSQMDEKQQDVRLTLDGSRSQALSIQVRMAPIHLNLGKQLGIKGKMEAKSGQLIINRKKIANPFICDRAGQETAFVRIQTDRSPITLKGGKEIVKAF